MLQITLPIKNVKAVSRAMAVKDVRYYLNGMLIEHNGKETRLVATDGHRIHAVLYRHEDGELCEPTEFIIPDTLVKTIINVKTGKKTNNMVTLSIADGKVSALLPDGTESVSKLVDATYPDYRRVIPESCTGEHAPLNPDYIIDAFDSARDHIDTRSRTFAFLHNGKGAAILAVGDFLAGVMPYECGASPAPNPHWKTPMEAPAKTESTAAA